MAGGISGNAVSITRSGNGLVNFGDNFGFTSGDFTISFWQKTSATDADSVVLAKHFAGSQNGYLFPVGPTGGGGAVGKENFTASTVVANGVTSTTTITDNVWHQIVGVYHSGGTHSIYVDGAGRGDQDHRSGRRQRHSVHRGWRRCCWQRHAGKPLHRLDR